ncbi:hypothetical protein IMSHALPRED_005335 [Imshaugia aleurites]|uniref:Mid2 domain-containing protein n=1 Tax=Imshaugia aleurites TaxID=172621 RepID=A0A8H3FCN8_9LECA|nr:hypothetical protein IMSHALPRED_005335 [Imshaugia aleurites]
MLFCVYLCLLLGGFSSAASLVRRQADDFSAENPDESDDSGLATGTAATAAAPTAAVGTTSNATTASNGTVKASSLSSAAAVATTASSALNSTNDPNMCHVEYTTDPEGDTYIANPFCKPYKGQEVYPNIQYQVTWDPSLFEDGANNTVQVYNVDATGLNSPTTADILASLNATNYQGSVFLNMSSAWLIGQPTANLIIYLIVNQTREDLKIFPGPTFTLLSTSSSDSTHSTPSTAPSTSKQLGEKVGIPIGLVFLIVAAIAVAAFVCFRKRKGKGYGAGKSLRQRVGGAAGRAHRRDPSFHDEPTTGVELKDRNKGLTGESPEDNWDWGSPVSSPTSAGGVSNAFRDEIQRQRSRR